MTHRFSSGSFIRWYPQNTSLINSKETSGCWRSRHNGKGKKKKIPCPSVDCIFYSFGPQPLSGIIMSLLLVSFSILSTFTLDILSTFSCKYFCNVTEVGLQSLPTLNSTQVSQLDVNVLFAPLLT